MRGIWHIQSPGRQGPIEASFWPRTNALWVEVHANREGEWSATAFERFTEEREAGLKGGSDGES
jgi:hypothetical protein